MSGYQGRRGSKKWKGYAKRYVYNGVDAWNRMFVEAGLPYRFKIVMKAKEK